MDGFFSTVAIRRKRRIHFHAFMRDVHEDLATLKREEDPLEVVAERIAKRSRLICFDEFHVSDIADAMILGRLLQELFEHGVVFVMTSNYPPDGLWPNGLQRQRFLPTITLIKHWLDVVEVDAGVDYRLRALERLKTWHMPLGAQADAELSSAFEAMRAGPDEDPKLVVEGRSLVARRPCGQRRLVRLRDAVRRPTVAARLPGPRVPVLGAVPVRHPADDGRDGRPRAALHLARRHTVRSPREATGLRGGRSVGPLLRGAEQPGFQSHGEPARRNADPRVHGRRRMSLATSPPPRLPPMSPADGTRSAAARVAAAPTLAHRHSNYTAFEGRLHCRNSRRTGRSRKTTRS